MEKGGYKNLKKRFGTLNAARKRQKLRHTGLTPYSLEYFADGRYKMNNAKTKDPLSIHYVSQLESEGGLSVEDQGFLDNLRIEAIYDVTIVRQIFDIRVKINAGIELSSEENAVAEKFGMPNRSSINEDKIKAAEESKHKAQESDAKADLLTVFEQRADALRVQAAVRADFLDILGQRAQVLEDASGPQSRLDRIVADLAGFDTEIKLRSFFSEFSDKKRPSLTGLNSDTDATDEDILPSIISEINGVSVEIDRLAEIRATLSDIRRERGELDAKKANLIDIEIKLAKWEADIDKKLSEIARAENDSKNTSLRLGQWNDKLTTTALNQGEDRKKLAEEREELEALRAVLTNLKAGLREQSEALDLREEEIARAEASYKVVATLTIAAAKQEAESMRAEAEKEIEADRIAFEKEMEERRAAHEVQLKADSASVIAELTHKAVIAANLEGGLILAEARKDAKKIRSEAETMIAKAEQDQIEVDLRIDSLRTYIGKLKKREKRVTEKEVAVDAKIAEASEILSDLIAEREELKLKRSAFDLTRDLDADAEIEVFEEIELELDENEYAETTNKKNRHDSPVSPSNGVDFDVFGNLNGPTTFDEYFADGDGDANSAYDLFADVDDVNDETLLMALSNEPSGQRYAPSDGKSGLIPLHQGTSGVRYAPEPGLDELRAQVNRLTAHGFTREPTKVVKRPSIDDSASLTPASETPVPAVLGDLLRTPVSPLPRVLPTEKELLEALSKESK